MSRRLKRSDNYGKLGFPGGKREPKDPDPRQAAARELAEEMGLVIREEELQCLGSAEFRTADFGRYRTTAYVLRIPAWVQPRNLEPQKHGPWMRIAIPAIHRLPAEQLLPGTKEFLREAVTA
jgi:8-oxo-dGTP pyrophosphatase MutT (NUDIX family)